MSAVQGSQEWLLSRCGHVTASCFADVLATVKQGEATSRRAYRVRVVAERITGKPFESYQNADMLRGQAQEPFARMAYEARTGILAVEVPFRKHPTIPLVGASPDGECDDDGALEIKSVLPHIQVETIANGEYPSKHKAQCQGVLWVTGRRWLDFVSFCPDLPGALSLYIFRVLRDDDYIATLEREIVKFNAEVDALYERLMRMAA